MSEKDTIRKVLNGETRFFGELVRKYNPQVVARLCQLLGNPEDAKDKAQEVWVKVWRKLGTYDPAFPFLAWVLGFALRAGLMEKRTRSRHCQPESLDALEPGSGFEPEADAWDEPAFRCRKKLQYEYLHKAMARVPKRWRDTLVCRYEDGMSYAEIAERTGRSIGTVGSDISRGLACLRREFLRLCPAGLLRERSV
jgi:RNA polymerase sigma-70 factor (ECF subfamily)